MNRKKFIKGLVGITGISLLSGLYSWQVEPFWLEFVKIKMPLNNLPKHLKGKTIMQISDMHVGNKLDYKYIINSFQKASKYKPDFVVYTGDYINNESPEQFKQLNEVMKYAIKGKSGTIGILGNHDYGTNWSQKEVAEKVITQFKIAGIDILRNEQKNINGLNFIGFDDYWSPNFYPAKVMKKYDKKKANIVLCHNPDVCDLNVWNDYRGWILSGHTHGGQFKPPFLNPPVLPVKNKRYSSGKIDLFDGRTLYINRALGLSVQVRFNVRPEITIFELQNI